MVRKGIADADLDVKVAKADFLPTLSIQSTIADITGEGIQNARVLGGGAFATLDLYTGGKRRGQLRAAQASVWRAAAQAKQVVDGVAYEVHYAHAAIDDARDRVAQLQTTVAQARESLRQIENRYKVGDAQPTDVIDAQTTWTRAEQDLSSAFYQYETAVARLEFAVGARVATAASAPMEAAVPSPSPPPPPPPPPAVTPSPFTRPESAAPPRRRRPSLGELPPVFPPLRGSSLIPSLTPPSPLLPSTPKQESPGPSLPETPGLSRPPYISQPPGRLP